MSAIYKGDYVFQQYLKKADAGNRAIRRMDANEARTVFELSELYNDFGTVLTELFTIVTVLRMIDDNRIGYVNHNLGRVINSMVKQRGLIGVVKNCYCRLKPDDEEMPEIRRFITSSRNRTKFVENSMIDANIELTPLKDYLEIVGRTLKEDLFAFFGSRREMCQASKSENDGILRYTAHVMDVLREDHAETKYAERLETYVQRQKEKQEKARLEKEAEKMLSLQKRLQDSMDVFIRRFHKAVYALDDDPFVGVSLHGIEHQIAQNGRDGYIILKCSEHNGKPSLRYMNGEKMTPNFYGAKGYRREKDAAAERARLASRQPQALFAVVQISNMERGERV